MKVHIGSRSYSATNLNRHKYALDPYDPCSNRVFGAFNPSTLLLNEADLNRPQASRNNDSFDYQRYKSYQE